MPQTKSGIEISVVIPCFNLGEFVAEAVDSVLSQQGVTLELIVVDDGSSDPFTVRTLDELSASRPIRLIRTENRGVAAARNRGLDESRGRFISFLDADDCLFPGALVALAYALENHPDAALAFPSGRRFGDVDHENWYPEFNRLRLLSLCMIPVPALLRKSLIHQCRFRTTDCGFEYEDWDFFIQATRFGDAVCVSQELYGYRDRKGSRLDVGLSHHDRVIEDMWKFNPQDFSPAGLIKVKRKWAPAVGIVSADSDTDKWRELIRTHPWLDAAVYEKGKASQSKYRLIPEPGAPVDASRLIRFLIAAESDADPDLPSGWQIEKPSPHQIEATQDSWLRTEDLELWSKLDERLWRMSLPAWTKTRLPNDLYELAGPRARLQAVAARMKRKGIARYALFGAGRHPEFLFDKGWFPVLPELIFDDFSSADALMGIPIVKPEAKHLENIDAILVCSDTFERRLYRRALEFAEARIPVLRLYT